MTDPSPRSRAFLGRRFFVVAFIIGAVSLTAIRPLLRRAPEPLPVLGEVPVFRFLDADGQSFGSAELAAQVYVVNFFFTTCPSICPALMQSMAELDRRYQREHVDGVRLVSISVDPERDTPDALREYAKKVGAAAPRWRLLTGERRAIVEFAENGLRVPVGEAPAATVSPFEIAHTGRFVLVDARGRVRGYYERSAEWGMDELFERSRQLLDERAP